MTLSGESVLEIFVYTVGTVLDNLLLGHLACLQHIIPDVKHIL